MMSNCPSCQTLIDEDFGLVTCHGCGATLFVELDGSLRANEESENAVADVVDSSGDVSDVVGVPDTADVTGEYGKPHLTAATDEDGPWDSEGMKELNHGVEGEVGLEKETLEAEVSGGEDSVDASEPFFPPGTQEEPGSEMSTGELAFAGESGADSDLHSREGGDVESEWSGDDWSGGQAVEPLVEDPPVEEVSADFFRYW